MEKVKEKVEKKIEKKIEDNSMGELIVLNDDFNTFVYVITILMTYCGISQEVALDCTMRIHNEGSSTIMKDKKSVLYPICENLIESGLSAIIKDSEEK